MIALAASTLLVSCKKDSQEPQMTFTNISGINFPGIDTANKVVMFTVKKANLYSMTVDFGCVRSSGSGVRNYALFFRDFIYPAQMVLPVQLTSFLAEKYGNDKIK